MSVLPIACEIVELQEKYESEHNNGICGRQVLRKHSFEDDINKLFEALESSHRRRSGASSRTSAMKRSVRMASPHVLDNGLSDSVNLKQALRGLCISQASEMAAAKKRSARPSASESVVSIDPCVAGRDSLNISSKTPKRGSGCPVVSDKWGQLPVLFQDLLNQSDEIQCEAMPRKTLMARKNSVIKKKSPNETFATKKTRSQYENKSSSEMEDEKRSKEKWGSSDSSKNSNIGECSSSSTTSYSEESDLYRPRMSRDTRWKAIGSIENQQGRLDLRHLKVLDRIGCGDIGIVYQCQLIGTSCFFAMKVMDTEVLRRRKKLQRAQTEMEILKILHHPFLPTLYAHFATNKFSCLVMDYCPGGDLHNLRLKQPMNRFSEKSARFYAAEVLLALEYLHILGVVYRDLKPENVLISEDGHIILSDFNLSVKCTMNPLLLEASSPSCEQTKRISGSQFVSSCMNPCQLTCFSPRFSSAVPNDLREAKPQLAHGIMSMPQPVVEPTTARSNSLVGMGKHEYLAPEIIRGEGHGSSVDWWSLGILLYELLYGVTPFKGRSNDDTVKNVISESIKFPETTPGVSSRARDLIRRLLNKEAENRLGSSRGAAEIKMHPFFQGMNWALIRGETPPEVPKLPETGRGETNQGTAKTTTKFEIQEEEKDLVMF